MNKSSEPELFPMRELVRRTGVNASTLRAWEARHGLIRPNRSASGHRLYSPQDVRRVQRLQDLLSKGLPLAEIAPLLDVDRSEGMPAEAGSQDAQTRTQWQGWIEDSLLAVQDFSGTRLDRQYSEACAHYPIDLVTSNLVEPVLVALGQRWDQRPSGIAEEHFYSAWLRNKLGARLHHYASTVEEGGVLVLACLPGELHEIGLLLFALAMLRQGYQVIYLGADMPLRQIVQVCEHCRPLAVVLAGREPAEPAVVLADLAWLVEHVDVPVAVGNHFSVKAKAEIEQAGGLALGDHIGLGIHLLVSRLAQIKRGVVRSRLKPPARP